MVFVISLTTKRKNNMKNIFNAIGIFLSQFLIVAVTVICLCVVAVLGAGVHCLLSSKQDKKTEIRNATIETIIITSDDYSYAHDFCLIRTGSDDSYSIAKARIRRSLSAQVKPSQRVGYIEIDAKNAEYEVIEVYVGTVPAENVNAVQLNQNH